MFILRARSESEKWVHRKLDDYSGITRLELEILIFKYVIQKNVNSILKNPNSLNVIKETSSLPIFKNSSGSRL